MVEFVYVHSPTHNMSCSTRKPTSRTLHNVSTQISLISQHRLIWADTFRLGGIEVKSNDSWNIKSRVGEKCLSDWASATCLGRSGLLLAESTMLVFSWNGSYILLLSKVYGVMNSDSVINLVTLWNGLLPLSFLLTLYRHFCNQLSDWLTAWLCCSLGQTVFKQCTVSVTHWNGPKQLGYSTI